MEQWKWIEGFEGLYQVSTYGRIKSYKKNSEGHILSYCLAGRGYPMVVLYKDKKQYPVLIHRAVATAFIKNDGKPCVNHIDEDKTNNHVENLEWCTYLENNVHGDRLIRIVKSRSWYKASDETKRKQSEMRKGKHCGGKPVMCVDTGEKFSSARLAEIKYGYRKGRIAEGCTRCGLVDGRRWIWTAV